MAAATQQRPTLAVWLGVGDIARSWVVNESKVLGFIKSGELRATNVATRAGGKPRWRVRPSDLEAFTAARAAVPQAPVSRRSRRKAGHVVEYF